MALAHLGLVDEQDHGLPLRRQPRQNLPPIGRHHRVADHMRVGQKPLDPLVAAVQPLGRARQARRHIHQVGAAHLKHRRHQQRQLSPLRLTLARQALLHVRRDGLGQLLDPTHSRRSAHPGALNHTPSLLATKLTHDKRCHQAALGLALGNGSHLTGNPDHKADPCALAAPASAEAGASLGSTARRDSGIRGDVVDAVGRHLAQLGEGEIVHPNRFGLALGAQLTAAVLDVSSSFFFVSNEIAGWPAVCQAFTRALMYSNWASRSGWFVPSRVLRLACRLKPSRRSSRPTSVWPAVKPRSVSARARWRWLLLTHSKAASGSPRMADCTSSPKASSRPGCVSTRWCRTPWRRLPNCRWWRWPRPPTSWPT